MSYVIATIRHGETLFMVDRSRQKKSFWSNRLKDVFVYSDYRAAEAKSYSLRYNSPHVLTLEEAKQIEQEQLNRKIEEQAAIHNDDSLLLAGSK